MMNEANTYQVGGDHYHGQAVQPWDIISMYGLDFFEGNCLKYLLRQKGNRLQELKKAKHYLAKKIENLEQATQAEEENLGV